jgi:hypothetical protein
MQSVTITTNVVSSNPACCLISSNVLFIQPLAFCRAKKVEKLCILVMMTAYPEISKMKYRNRIAEPGTILDLWNASTFLSIPPKI